MLGRRKSLRSPPYMRLAGGEGEGVSGTARARETGKKNQSQLAHAPSTCAIHTRQRTTSKKSGQQSSKIVHLTTHSPHHKSIDLTCTMIATWKTREKSISPYDKSQKQLNGVVG